MTADDIVKIVVIAGPTASGKSSLAVKIAGTYDAEIISADSRQIYRQLKIGTDRLDESQWQGIPHHLMGSHDLDESFTAFDFVSEAERAIEAARGRGKRVIICGGTGLYMRALIDGIYELPDGDVSYRNELLDLAAARGPKFIHDMLAEVDPEEASQVHYNNMIRVIRALEIYHLTGKPKSSIKAITEPRNENYRFLQIILSPPRDELYNRIEQRVDEMFTEGLPDEVNTVLKSEYGSAMRQRKIVGYSELIDYLEDEITIDEARRLIKQNTRRYAKRQFTWFRRISDAIVVGQFGADAYEKAAGAVETFWH